MGSVWENALQTVNTCLLEKMLLLMLYRGASQSQGCGAYSPTADFI